MFKTTTTDQSETSKSDTQGLQKSHMIMVIMNKWQRTLWTAVMGTDGIVLVVSDLVFNHAAYLREKILADDMVEVTVLWGGFVLDALCQADPLFLCITHEGPNASLTAWQKEKRGTEIGLLIQKKTCTHCQSQLQQSTNTSTPCFSWRYRAPLTCGGRKIIQSILCLDLAFHLAEGQKHTVQINISVRHRTEGLKQAEGVVAHHTTAVFLEHQIGRYSALL